MAVLDRSYRRWDGRPTPYWQRMLVIPRYAVADFLSKKAYLVAFVVMLLPPVGLAIAVYLSVNLPSLKTMLPLLANMPDFQVGTAVYHVFWGVQISFATFFSIIVGPPLFSGDMANNALPLYFSKALRQVDYVAGKALVLVGLISIASWMPLCLISLLHYAMADAAWRVKYGGTFFAVLAPSLALIVTFTAIILAVSATVQRTRLARAALFAVFVLSSAFGGVLAVTTRVDAFRAVSPVVMVRRVGEWAFDAEKISSRTGQLVGNTVPVSRGLALFSLTAWTLASGFVISRRIRPAEEVK